MKPRNIFSKQNSSRIFESDTCPAVEQGEIQWGEFSLIFVVQKFDVY